MPVAADLYYYAYQGEENERPPVVLIHGAGGNYLYWPPEVRRLPGFRVYALDLPGHGMSGGRGQQSIHQYSLQIIEWLEAMGMNRAAFVGHSMGSAIALDLGIHHPEHVAGLGLIGGGPRLQVHPEILANSANPTTFHNAVDLIVNGSFSPSASPRLVKLATGRMAEMRPSVLNGDLLACDAFDVTADLHRIQQPALVLCGADDRMTPVRFSQFLASAIQRAQLKVIPEAGHMVQLEKPAEVSAALVEFLDGVPYQAGES